MLQAEITRVDGGRRKDPLFNRSGGGKPLVTVVTVVFNCVTSVEKTILSVTGQSYANVEYIVIDGGSTDGTVEILKKYDNQIDYWLSEKDSGIFCAMNKGIDLSTGEWINFMNAGDCFNSDKSIENIASSFDERFAIVAGGVRYIYDAKNTRIKHMRTKFSGFYMTVPHHQASFTSNRLMKQFKYDESFRIRGDLYFMALLHANGHKFLHTNDVICDVDTNGVSSGISWKHINEDIRAGSLVIRNYRLKCVIYHALYVIPRLMLRKILPKPVESKIRSLIRN